MKSQEQSITQVSNKEYIVGSINKDGVFSIASFPIGHKTQDLAVAECARLAKLYPGKAFFYARLMGGCVSSQITEF